MTNQWSIELLQDAAAKHEFILVTPTSSSRVPIIDAQRLWMINPRIIFQTGYRIAGTPEDITSVLISQYSQDEVAELVETAITHDNYHSTMKPIYNDEVVAYNTWKRSAVKVNDSAPGVKLFDIMAAVNPVLLNQVKSTKQAKALGVTVAGKTVSRAAKPLAAKLAALPFGKVLDVSKLKDNGSGATTSDPPLPGGRSKKYGSPTLPIISSDLDHYLLALSMLPGGVAAYNNEVISMTNLFAQVSIGKPAAKPLPTGFAPPPTGYAPLPTGYAPLPTGFALPPTVYAPLPTGFALPPTGYAPPPTGFAPPPMPILNRPGMAPLSMNQLPINLPKDLRPAQIEEPVINQSELGFVQPIYSKAQRDKMKKITIQGVAPPGQFATVLPTSTMAQNILGLTMPQAPPFYQQTPGGPQLNAPSTVYDESDDESEEEEEEDEDDEEEEDSDEEDEFAFLGGFAGRKKKKTKAKGEFDYLGGFNGQRSPEPKIRTPPPVTGLSIAPTFQQAQSTVFQTQPSPQTQAQAIPTFQRLVPPIIPAVQAVSGLPQLPNIIPMKPPGQAVSPGMLRSTVPTLQFVLPGQTSPRAIQIPSIPSAQISPKVLQMPQMFPVQMPPTPQASPRAIQIPSIPPAQISPKVLQMPQMFPVQMPPTPQASPIVPQVSPRALQLPPITPQVSPRALQLPPTPQVSPRMIQLPPTPQGSPIIPNLPL